MPTEHHCVVNILTTHQYAEANLAIKELACQNDCAKTAIHYLPSLVTVKKYG